MKVMTKSIPPGLSANELEIYWDESAKELFGLYGGQKMKFAELPSHVLSMLEEDMLNDNEAIRLMDRKGPKLLKDRLYLYCKCKYGGFSWEPDLSAHGVLTSECWECNCEGNCILKPLFRGSLQVGNGSLTLREIEVIKKLTTSTYQIGDAVAQELGIAASTLNKHKRSIYEKIGVDSIQALAVWASKMNL